LIDFVYYLVSCSKITGRAARLRQRRGHFAVSSFLVVVSASLLYLVESDRCEERGLPCAGFETERKKRVEMNSGINLFSS
jgi:hypothetical protein